MTRDAYDSAAARLKTMNLNTASKDGEVHTNSYIELSKRFACQTSDRNCPRLIGAFPFIIYLTTRETGTHRRTSSRYAHTRLSQEALPPSPQVRGVHSSLVALLEHASLQPG